MILTPMRRNAVILIKLRLTEIDTKIINYSVEVICLYWRNRRSLNRILTSYYVHRGLRPYSHDECRKWPIVYHERKDSAIQWTILLIRPWSYDSWIRNLSNDRRFKFIWSNGSGNVNSVNWAHTEIIALPILITVCELKSRSLLSFWRLWGTLFTTRLHSSKN